MKIFKEYINMNKGNFILIALSASLLSLITIPLPYFSKIIIDNILVAQKYSSIRVVACIFLVILIIQVSLGRFNSVISAKFGQNFNKFMKNQIVTHFINGNSCDQELGDVQNTVLTDTDLLSSNMMSVTMIFFSNVSTIIGFTVVLLLISIRLTFITLVFVPIYLLWITHVSEKLRMLSKKSQNNKSAILEEVNNAYNNHFTIRTYKLFKQVQDKFSYVIDENARLTEETLIYNNFVTIISGIIVTTAAFVPLLVGVFFVEQNFLSIGELIAFNSYCGLLFTPITNMIKLQTILKTSTVYETRINKVITSSEYKTNFYGAYKGKSNLNIQQTERKDLIIDNFSLCYGNNTLIQNSNMKLLEGEVVRLQGDNGTGKTSLLKAIVQDIKTYSGSIKFNGKDLKYMELFEVAPDIIYVSNNQGFYLSTLKDNLINGSSYTLTEIWDILKLVQLDRKIRTLESGIDTATCDMMKSFSSGELQKLRLARALIKRPKVLLLDEVFSNIDANHSGQIFKEIKVYSPDISVILIEHHDIGQIIIDKTWIIKNQEVIVQ